MSLLDYINSPEMEQARKELRDAVNQYEGETRAWWDSLSEKEREDAFYMVCKLIKKGDIIERGSYRYVLYTVFGFDMAMYGQGMECGYMDIHNAIHNGYELNRMQNAEGIDISLPNDTHKHFSKDYKLIMKEKEGRASIVVEHMPQKK